MHTIHRRECLHWSSGAALALLGLGCPGDEQRRSQTTSSAPSGPPSVARPTPSARTGKPTRPPSAPDFADEAYGPHPLQRFDLWRAKSPKPTPLLLYIHGGGFMKGDKRPVNPIMAKRMLKSGISFASLNYRLSHVAPYPAQMHDGARAVQYLRHHAQRFNLDPRRIAAGGVSAGSGISQWLAFHDDLAQPGSPDRLKRESTRLSCAIGIRAQCTYDPRRIKRIVPGEAYDHVALKRFHKLPDDWSWDDAKIDERLDKLLRDCSPITHLTKDDPPVLLVHHTADDKVGNIHHPNFASHLKKKMDELGIECLTRMDSDYDSPRTGPVDEMLRFLKKHFHA